MKIADFPSNEQERLGALLRYKVLDTDFEDTYNELTQLASDICQTPIALISLIDRDRQWFKAKVGLEASETPRDWAFCAHALLQEDILVVEDALLDARFSDNPLVINDPLIRFYAGAQLKTAQGLVLGTICAIDRVPRHLSEQQLHALKVLAKQVMSQFELRLAFEELQAQAQRLHQLNATKDKLFSIISHDLRAPLSGIFSVSEILLEDIHHLELEDTKQFINDIHEASQQSLSLLDNLLRWSLLETGKFNYQPVTIDLLAVIQKVLRLLNGAIVSKRISLKIDCQANLSVVGDKNMLASVIQNLLSNAIKFTHLNGIIEINVIDNQDQTVLVSIKDNGVGMTDEQQKQLFAVEKNQSTHGTQGETGTGLGLVLSYQFLKIHGSILMVKSELGKGAVFSFKLNKS